MLPLDRDHLVRTLATRLSGLAGTWTPDGVTIRSEGSPLIVVTDLHDGAQDPNHVDVGVALNPEHPDAPVLWDCAAGSGRTPVEIAETAAHMWLETTGNTVLELLTQKGDFAAHIPGDDAAGLPGFHVIHGPVLPFGADREPLLRWVLENPLLPALRDTLPTHLDDAVNGVKLLFGGDPETVEVRVNGVVREAPTSAIRRLDWPRSTLPTYVKTFLIAFREQA